MYTIYTKLISMLTQNDLIIIIITCR